jgi:hypothetical protein
MSFLQNAKCVLSIKLHKCDDLHEDWIWLDTDKYVDFNSCISVSNALATRGISSRDEFCDDNVGCHSTQEEEQGDECVLEAEQSFAKAHAAHTTIKSSFYTNSTGEHDEQNIFEQGIGAVLSEMLGFNIWLSVTDFFGKNVTCMQVLM